MSTTQEPMDPCREALHCGRCKALILPDEPYHAIDYCEGVQHDRCPEDCMSSPGPLTLSEVRKDVAEMRADGWIRIGKGRI